MKEELADDELGEEKLAKEELDAGEFTKEELTGDGLANEEPAEEELANEEFVSEELADEDPRGRASHRWWIMVVPTPVHTSRSMEQNKTKQNKTIATT